MHRKQPWHALENEENFLFNPPPPWCYFEGATLKFNVKFLVD